MTDNFNSLMNSVAGIVVSPKLLSKPKLTNFLKSVKIPAYIL